MRISRALVVDDNVVDRERIRRLLGCGWDVVEAATAREGVAAANAEQFDCVLLDHRLPDQDGVDVIEDFIGRALPVLILTAQGSENIAVEAMKRGAVDYLSKTRLDHEMLHRAIRVALDRQQMRSEVERHNRERDVAVQALERKRRQLEATNRALAEREAHLRIILEQLPALLWTTDRELCYTSVGGADPRAMGLDASTVLGRSVDAALVDAIGNDDATAAHRQALAGVPAHYNVSWKGRSYECNVEPLCSVDGTIVGTVGIGLDRSEAKQTEQRLHHAAKMEALGKLSGGIAHDFNNVLSAIISFTELARCELREEDPIRKDLDEVLRASNQATGLVRQLLAFSRRDRVVPRVVAVGETVSALLPMLRRLCGEDLRIEMAARESFLTLIDPGRLEQVVINLAVNARDAMPNGGCLFLETYDATIGASGADPVERLLAAGDYAVISVRDEGTGMPKSVVDRIFEPFYTTKSVGEGTGLGLSTVHGIVRKAGGTILVDSEVGSGTTFRVYLPRTSTVAAEATTAAVDTVPRGTETILVVEDEEQVRAVAVRSLRRLGYRVIEASRGSAVRALLDGDCPAIDLLLTDVVMPGMCGPEVASLVLASSPRTAVVYMSGYSDESTRGRRTVPEDAFVLEKPLRPDLVGHAVRRVLDSKA